MCHLYHLHGITLQRNQNCNKDMGKKNCLLFAMTCSAGMMFAGNDYNATIDDRVDSLAEVEVFAARTARSRVDEVQIGVEKIDLKEMQKLPALFGERDIFRSLQYLPGVKTDGEGSCGFEVRGGTSAQNLVLLDNAAVYNAGHLVGIFSAFNDQAIGSASLYKGQIPAKYGGCTSSVLTMATHAADMEQWHGGASVGLIMSKINAEGPIFKDKASILVAARRSYLDVLLQQMPDYKDNTLNFYDVNSRIDWKPSANNRVSLSFYHGKDNMAIGSMMYMHWKNTTLTGAWSNTAAKNLVFRTSATYSKYGSDLGYEISKLTYDMKGHIAKGFLREDITWTPGSSHTVTTGFEAGYQDVMSAEWMINKMNEKDSNYGWNSHLWVNDDWKVGDILELSAGLRFVNYGEGPDFNMDIDLGTYNKLEPRLSVKFTPADGHSIKFGYSRSSQEIHAIRNNDTSSPFDRFTISKGSIKPETSDQISLGYFGMTKNEAYDFSIEGYYKWMNNIYDYKDGKSFYTDINLEDLILGGKARAYGLEFCAHKNKGKLRGWASYTLSWTQNKIDGINNGNWYWANHDRRHDINIVGMYQLNKNWDFSATFTFNTGMTLTAPCAKYVLDGETRYYYSERNGYRAPSVHHLDISATNTKKVGKFERQWSFGIYNIYNQQNPYAIWFEEDQKSATGTKCKQTSLFGLIPFVSLSYSL